MNYFNSLNFRQKLINLRKCKLVEKNFFSKKCDILKRKNIVIVGCGSQGLNQGLNMRDSGLHVSYALRGSSILNKNKSWENATKNNFFVDTYENIIPTADLVINLTPDKQRKEVVTLLQKFMKENSVLGFSHGFHIVEIGQKIRNDITVIMVAPKCPGTEVREEYKKGFGVPSLIAVHMENDPKKIGFEIAKAWAYSLGSHRAGVLHSSFIAEVKSDLMGEQTILCGMLQTSSLVCYDQLVSQGKDPNYAGKLIQLGWESITESVKHGGITLMLNRLSNTAKIRAYILSKKLKVMFSSLFRKHMDDIISGEFSKNMIDDWNSDDKKLKEWRTQIKKTDFEKCKICHKEISEQEYFDQGLLMVAILKAGIELSFEIMVETGIKEESAYYESLHELPLIANTIARKRLYEMNLVISDTAEYGSYLFSQSAIPLLKEFMNELCPGDLGEKISDLQFDNVTLNKINHDIENHPVEIIGKKLRKYMVDMKPIKLS
uniref:Ketol-acid reductoisomerase (NADP(+)) n=1 Tax=Buchnera aphidicola subsp. Schlechtendalia chinensis TaxID=118110 RepID=ILVC_BUCSC|nr:RecName: Full=Ketol-acid reductoisomerase (NADP(+)); Short=KARI; AltName: Full=Acetohydroxy-acid isomeroreductase; Short=AHIR; AltName: Full=Alpha-keto-beta-hydroxylacyl reductoisomerase; AltName: Full=Ketol-acid reductoisomerase type 2; AltName: Full=Ketol-acid reductoisomerase type II [Buchnera aphidicola (Schlechtendalia chinensis)]AAF13803.1 acetohydroxy acid isomeroreductase [Buchnera aphidicola]